MSRPMSVLLMPRSVSHACIVDSDSGFGSPDAPPNNRIASMRGWRRTSRIFGFAGAAGPAVEGATVASLKMRCPLSCAPPHHTEDADRAGVSAHIHRTRPVARRIALRELQAQVRTGEPLLLQRGTLQRRRGDRGAGKMLRGSPRPLGS